MHMCIYLHVVHTRHTLSNVILHTHLLEHLALDEDGSCEPLGGVFLQTGGNELLAALRQPPHGPVDGLLVHTTIVTVGQQVKVQHLEKEGIHRQENVEKPLLAKSIRTSGELCCYSDTLLFSFSTHNTHNVRPLPVSETILRAPVYILL